MIDYLCLKLRKLTEDILDMPHFDCQRKFVTYRAMETLEKSLPITAYPIISDEGSQQVNDRVREAQDKLSKQIGIPLQMPESELKEDPALLEALKAAVGSELIDIKDVIPNG